MHTRLLCRCQWPRLPPVSSSVTIHAEPADDSVSCAFCPLPRMPLIDCVALNRHSSPLHDGTAAPRSEGRRAAMSRPHALPTSCCKASACMLCGYLPFKRVASVQRSSVVFECSICALSAGMPFGTYMATSACRAASRCTALQRRGRGTACRSTQTTSAGEERS